MEKQKPQQIQIRSSENDLKGAYSNVMQVTHTQEEFVLDFFNIMGQTGVLSSRVILSPSHFKRMVQAMEDNLKKYEEHFGLISPSQSPVSPPQEIGFRPQ